MTFLTLENVKIAKTLPKQTVKGGFGYGKTTVVKTVVERLPLRVVMGSLEVTPNININVTDLNKSSDGTLYKHFLNQSDYGITFKCDIIISKNDWWHSDAWGTYRMMKSKEYKNYQKNLKKNGAAVEPSVETTDFKVLNVLRVWVKNMFPVKVVTKAIDVPNGVYIITGNPTRKQEYENYTTWTLEFTTYNPLNLAVYKNNNAAIKKAISNQKKSQAKNSIKARFKKCKLSTLKYSKKQKTVACVKYMQTILYKKGCLKKKSQIDGWYGKVTCGAVRQFQNKYKKKYKLKVTSGTKVDKATFNAMCKV